MSADKELPVVAWIVEHGAVSLPIGDPSRIVTVEAFDNEADADASAQASDFNTQIGPVTWQLSASARIAELEQQLEQARKDADRWRAMRQTFVAVDWAWNSPPIPVAIFELHANTVRGGPSGADEVADAAIASQGAAQEAGK